MLSNTTCSRRIGHTLVEVTVALALIAVLGGIVAQAIVWSLRERQRLATENAANEVAANALEAARALPIEQLTPSWAESQTLPSEVAGAFRDGRLLVRIEAVQGASQAKRVTAEVRWQQDAGVSPRSVTLATVLAGRTAAAKEAQP